MGITEREPEEGSVSNQPADQPPAQRLRSVYFWAMSGTFAAQGALWVLSLLVMRVLQPGDYGLVGIIGVFFGFCRTVQDAGLGAAIVQTPNLNRRLLNATFWFFIAVSIVLTVGGIVGAPFLGRAKGEARLPAVMSTLAFTFIILAIRAVPMALLTRKLEFRKRSMAEIYSAVLGSVITVILAYTGHGVWSLVFGNLANEIVLTALCCFHAHWRPDFDCDWQGLKELLRFGLPVTGGILLWQFYVDSDFLVISLLLDPKQLGFYTLAWQLGMVPADRLSAVLNKANLPVFSSLQNDPDGVRRHWNRLVSMVPWTAFPVAAGIALVGGEFLHLCLPAKWDGAVPILPALSILGGMRSIERYSAQRAHGSRETGQTVSHEYCRFDCLSYCICHCGSFWRPGSGRLGVGCHPTFDVPGGHIPVFAAHLLTAARLFPAHGGALRNYFGDGGSSMVDR